MALEQALALKNISFLPPLKITKPSPSPSPALNPNPSLCLLASPFRPNIKHLRCNLTAKCSLEYGSNYYEQPVAYPKPSEIPWKKEHCNAVHLIGNVGAPVQIKHLGTGKTFAWTRLAIRKSATETVWINLTFWDELAHVAYQHVEKGHQVYILGRLVSDTVENDEGRQQIYYKVVVQQLNFVERNVTPMVTFDGDSNSMAAGRKLGNSAANNSGSVEELWQAFFANPVDWWDNRKNKRNPKYPDFKHKDTGEALWIEGKYNPPWVRSQLAILDSRMASLQDQDSRLAVSPISADSVLPF